LRAAHSIAHRAAALQRRFQSAGAKTRIDRCGRRLDSLKGGSFGKFLSVHKFPFREVSPMLLDPRLNVAEVSERCGFCNPAYFASVFKKYVHCTPREFASQPAIWRPLLPAAAQYNCPTD
jgi:AraC-like DNA-binding protein